MSSSQIIGNNAGTAVPVAVDSSGNVRVSVSGPVIANLYADDGSGTVPVAGEATGELKAQALGTTSGGVLTPLLVDSQGRVVTSGGGGGPGPPGPPGYSTAILTYRANTTPGTGNPGSGLVQWNATNQLLATQFQISHIDQASIDVEVLFASLFVGGTVRIQDRSDSANYQLWTITGAPVIVTGGYVRVPATLSGGTWSAPSNHQLALFVNLGAQGAVALYSEIPLFHADFATTSTVPVRLACRTVDVARFPLVANGLGLVVRLNATLASSAGTCSLALTDITLLTPAPIVNGTLVGSSSSPTSVVSLALPVGNVAGSLWTSPIHLYELTLVATAPNTASCAAAWLSFSYE
jgi:hypothetical protein